MKSSILAGTKGQERDELLSSFLASARFRERLSAILQQKVDTNNKITKSKDAYNIANWSYLQADAVGYERALMEVCALLSNE